MQKIVSLKENALLKRLILLLNSVVLTTSVFATNYYVSTEGSATGKGTLDNPYATIAKAAQAARGGDTVYVAGGVYQEMDIKPKYSGSQSAGYVVYKALPGTGRVVLSKRDNGSGDNDRVVINLESLSYIWIEGFEFTNMQYLSGCISMNQSAHCVVTGNKFENLGNEEVAPYWGGDAMVRLYNTTDCVVSNNYFSNVTGDGVEINGQKTKRNLICNNTFAGLKGKKRSWAEEKYKYSSSITGQDMSYGNNVICFNHITGGQDGIWLDRDGSRNIVVRNMGFGGQRLVFNESRCAYNWIQENVACNMTESGYRSALYDGTNWTFDTRWVNNVAYNCKNGFYMHKSKHNEVRNNIAYGCSEYSLVLTDSAAKYGQNVLRNNLWYAPSKSLTIQYKGREMTPSNFARQAGETGGIYGKSPMFVSTSKPYSFELKEGSPCQMSGDGGVSVGAYPVFGHSLAGADSTCVAHRAQPYFADLISEVTRGEEYVIKVCLTNPSSDNVSVNISAVAGDVWENEDFVLSASELTFQPGETVKELTVGFKDKDVEFSQLLVLKLSVGNGQISTARSYTVFKIITDEEYEKQKSADIWLEAEDGNVGSLWLTTTDSRASGKKYVTVKTGNNSSGSAPAGENGWLSYTFDVKVASTYALWLRTICPNANDDSFWLRMDDCSWTMWNDIPTSSAWKWNQSSKSYNLTEGLHTLYIGYREDGAKIDKLLLSCNQTVPEGMGEDVSGIDDVIGESGSQEVYVYDLRGRMVARGMNGLLAPGVYVVKRVIGGVIDTKKVIIR